MTVRINPGENRVSITMIRRGKGHGKITKLVTGQPNTTDGQGVGLTNQADLISDGTSPEEINQDK